MKALYLVLFVLLVSACSDSSNKSEPPVEETKKINPSNFTATQSGELTPYGESMVLVELKNLEGDDAVYLTIASDEMDNDKIEITPFKTILNPNNGSASVKLKVKDLGSVGAPSLNINITTSSNSQLDQELTLEWSNQ